MGGRRMWEGRCAIRKTEEERAKQSEPTYNVVAKQNRQERPYDSVSLLCKRHGMPFFSLLTLLSARKRDEKAGSIKKLKRITNMHKEKKDLERGWGCDLHDDVLSLSHWAGYSLQFCSTFVEGPLPHCAFLPSERV